MKLTHVAAAVLLRPDGSFLLGQRASDTFYPGYWEFPGGKVEAGETPRQALVRELREELDIEVTQCYPWIMREHRYEHAHVVLHFFRVTAWEGELRDHVHAALSWQWPGAVDVNPMLPANGPVLKALALPDFYAVTHAAEIGVDTQLAAIEQALPRGLRLLQIREGALPEPLRTSFAVEAVRLMQGHGGMALVNGDVDLALESGADGIHLPASQFMQLGARPDFRLVGTSCHNAMELRHAIDIGADFAVIGAVHATPTHAMQAGMGWERFREIAANSAIPVFAIGGLTSGDKAVAWEHGAHGIAAIRAAWGV